LKISLVRKIDNVRCRYKEILLADQIIRQCFR
jgi:hypothetical protein